MAYEVPDAYFPGDPYVKFGFAIQRTWKTLVTPSPTGTRQVRSLWLQPKRRVKATILGYDRTAFKTIRDFLFTRRGQALPYYIFNWYKQDYDQDPKPAVVTMPGLLPISDTNPIVLPFKGGTVNKIYRNGSLVWGPGDFLIDDSGPGGEKRIIGLISGPAWVDGDLAQVEIVNTRERIPVVSLTDTDDFQFDWSAAEPPIETGLEVEEVF